MAADDKINRPRNVLPDLIIPVLALAFAAYYLTTITEVPWISQASAIVVSGLLAASTVAYFMRTAYRIRRGREVLGVPRPFGPTLVSLRRIMLLALSIAYVALIDTLGFTLTTMFFIFLGIVVLSSIRNWARAAGIAVVSSVTGYVVFIHFFQTRFPRGPVENLLKGML